MDFIEIGASLYLPATRTDLVEIGNGVKHPNLRSVIFCTEDAVAESDVELALEHIEEALYHFKAHIDAPYKFIRPRNPTVLKRLLQMKNIDRIQGFVLPKFTLGTMEQWFSILEKKPTFTIMPILETREVFDTHTMNQLCSALLRSPLRKQIAVLRIGGLDLLNILNFRRSDTRTIYDTALSHVIKSLVNIFIPHGFYLSAPAFESIDNVNIMKLEVELDMLHGLYHKSIIHPTHIKIMEEAYKVPQKDLEAAELIVDINMPPVFRLHGRMCEKKTHHKWAQRTLVLAKLYGVKPC